MFVLREERHYMRKDWSRYALARHRDAIWDLDRKLLAQQEAMTQLRLESEDLYRGGCFLQLLINS